MTVFLGVCGGVGVWGVGVVLAVNVKAMEGRYMSNISERCFMMFYYDLSVYSYLCCVELSTCPF